MKISFARWMGLSSFYFEEDDSNIQIEWRRPSSQEVWGYGPEGYGQKYGPTRAFYNYYLTSLDHHNYLKGCNVDKKLI